MQNISDAELQQAGFILPPFHFHCRTTTAAVETELPLGDEPQAGKEPGPLEQQRYGRNKETTINHTYINGGEYRRKFDKITDNVKVSRVLYSKAKEMLNHRSGTKYEDMYWIDGETGEIVARALDEKREGGVSYSKAVNKAISGKKNLIAFHTHPNSMPPSASDFNSMFKHGYKKTFVVCHDGKIIQYASRQEISESLYNLQINRFLVAGFSEYEAQWKTLGKLKRNHNIDFWEVLP